MDNPFKAPETNQETQDTQIRKPVLCGLLLIIVAVGLPGFKWAFKEYELRQMRHLPEAKNYLT